MQYRDGNAPPPPLSSLGEWLLTPEVTFLNHGSFGAVPRTVFEKQQEWRKRIEAQPIELLGRQAPQLIDAAKSAVASWLRVNPADFGFVTNATEGVNAVLGSLRLREGDELLTTTHVYNAVRQAMKLVARKNDASYREIDLSLPIASSQQIVDRIIAGLSPHTRLLVIDHITSPTALVFPVREIVAECRKSDVDVLIDGAHAPGMLDLDVSGIGAAYYAGNLHKWSCAPKGSAFLWVRPDRQNDIHPAVVSHNLDQGFAKEFEWQGTRDLSAHLVSPLAIEYMARLGWENVRRHNHELAVWAHRLLCERWHVDPISPLDGSLLGAMATMRLPGRLAQLTEQTERELQRTLYDRFRMEVPVIRWGESAFIRVSCQVYNEPRQYERLGGTIEALIAE